MYGKNSFQPPPGTPAFHEHRAIALIVKRFDLIDMHARLQAQVEHRSSDEMTFEKFAIAFPSFPVVLRTALITDGGPPSNKTLARMLVHPARSFVIQEYVESWQAAKPACGTRAFGIFFECRGRHGGMVVHGGDFGLGKNASVMIHMPGLGSLQVQPFRDLLKAIRNQGWSPYSDSNAVDKVPSKLFDPNAPLDPLIRDRLGDSCPAKFLNLLINLSTCKLPSEFACEIRRSDGLTWMSIQQATIAKMLHRGVRVVKEAVPILQKRGLLKVSRLRDGGNEYAIDTAWRQLLTTKTDEPTQEKTP